MSNVINDTIFELYEKFKDADGVMWINGREGNRYPPHIWPDAWIREDVISQSPIEHITFEQIRARHFVSEVLGVAFEISPEDTYVLSLEANLPPIPDGKEWRAGLNLAVGTIVTFGGSNYQVIQPHISQAGWSPSLTPALFKQLREAYAEWVQPLGAHDAYMIGDRVLHNGAVWESTHDGNVWMPGVFGWTKV